MSNHDILALDTFYFGILTLVDNKLAHLQSRFNALEYLGVIDLFLGERALHYDLLSV